MHLSGGWRVVALAFLLLACGDPRAVSDAQPHFGIGPLSKVDSRVLEEWVPSTKVPWTYVWTVLEGGVDTGSGWADKPAGGRYALDFATKAASHGSTPTYIYYQAQTSIGKCKDCAGDQVALNNLNDPDLMKKLLADFRLLMQRLGPDTYDGVKGFGRLAFVNVEPNLSAYVDQAVTDPDPRCYGLCPTSPNGEAKMFPVALSKTCDPDVVGLPDNYVGYNQALLRIRDMYAPNVKLGFNISPWSQLVDITSDTRPGFDTATMGRNAGEFAAQSGAGSYDLLFTDVAWGESGYYKYKLKTDKFWDALNQTRPNFSAWEQFVKAAADVTEKSVMLWQIPVGNQSFLTMNNSPGHYQDNRGEYMLSHLDELISNGIVGILFGGGPQESTNFYDAMKDGVTNPTSICTSDGLSDGQVCTNKRSTVTDDDGGWLRTAGATYLRNPVVLTGPHAAAIAPRDGATPAAHPSAGVPASCG